MRWLAGKWITFKHWLKHQVAGEELLALERYREACEALQTWEPNNRECRTTARWIQRHGDSMQSEVGRAMHLLIGKRTHEAMSHTY